ncbi:MAG: LysM peptidoglycan-binding domain-containing protein [bacterium]
MLKEVYKKSIFAHMKRLIISGIFLIIFMSMAALPGFSISPAPRYHRVRKGDYLIDLGEKYGVAWERIKKVNTLRSDKIYPGQKLLIPWKGVWHTVREGEYLKLIAKAYGKAYRISEKVIMKEIAQANRITNLDKIIAGRKLFIPRAKKTLEIQIPGRKLPQPRKGTYHTIRKGETLYRIALNYGKEQGLTEKEMEKKIIKANNISDSTKLRVGDKLFVPGAKESLEIKIPAEVLTSDVTASSPPPISMGKPKKIPEYRLSEKKTLSRPEPLKTSEKEPIFSWPVEGEVIGYFGDKGNKGIDIAAPEGTTIVAPADGVVELAGYDKDLGNLLMIKHKKEGLITVYTYLSSSLVGSGHKVKKGDPIATVGITGTAKVPCLHFEVRKIGTVKPVNPLDYLP